MGRGPVFRGPVGCGPTVRGACVPDTDLKSRVIFHNGFITQPSMEEAGREARVKNGYGFKTHWHGHFKELPAPGNRSCVFMVFNRRIRFQFQIFALTFLHKTNNKENV